MKCIWLGIKDYCKDYWHDWLLKHINRFPECKVYAASYKGDNTKEIHYVLWDRFWKEGSVWHYIKQRRLAKKAKKKGYNHAGMSVKMCVWRAGKLAI